LAGPVAEFGKSDTTLTGKGIRPEGKNNEFQNDF